MATAMGTISCMPRKPAAMCLLPGFPDLLGVNAAGDGIEDGQLCLLNRRDGIIDRETRLPLKSLGISFSAPDLSLSFSLGNSGLQRLDVGDDFRFQCIPVSAGGVLDGLDLLIHLFRRRRRSSVCLFSARLDFFMRFLLRRSDRILCIFGAN